MASRDEFDKALSEAPCRNTDDAPIPGLPMDADELLARVWEVGKALEDRAGPTTMGLVRESARRIADGDQPWND